MPHLVAILAPGNCYYFNPFGNSFVNPDGTRQTDQTLVNPAELYEYLLGRVTSDTHFEQDVFDAVMSGTVANLDSGPVGLAVGLQHRVDKGARAIRRNYEFW